MGWAIGLMTGTALDGAIDAALIRGDGQTLETLGPYLLHPCPAGLTALLKETVAAARDWAFTGPEPGIFARAEAALTEAQAGAALALLGKAGLTPREVEIIGFHGQTVLHRGAAPGRPGATRQLGDGARMAALTGIDVAFDFRAADVAAGGQGAPLAPIWHRALLARAGLGPETAALNLGGVGNLTWVSPEGALRACDSGPANGPLNDWAARCGAGGYDRDGALALAGRVDQARLAQALRHPYLRAPWPKSLDRHDFGWEMAKGLSAGDGAATLTAFAAACVGAALDLLPRRPRRAVLCGGGRKNPALVAALETHAAITPVQAEAVGWRGDAVEAECFAWLALRCARGLPISFPGTTGAPAALGGGRIRRARPAR